MQDTPLQVLPYSVQPDGEGFIIGSPRSGKFLSVPGDVVEILAAFKAGRSPAAVHADYLQRHGEAPDLDDLIAVLTGYGILATGAEAPSATAPRRGHFDRLVTPALGRLLWNRFTLAAMAAVVLAAVVVLWREPSLLPGWRALYFPNETALQLLGVMLLGMASTFVHEMAHLSAARAAGVSCRFSIGNQLWFVVWYTDMSGIWALPRERRYLPILAGPIVDLVSAALIVLVLAAARHWHWGFAPLTVSLLSALLFVYLLRILWQCYFFLRTDFYYAASNLLGCKRLLQDTEDWLRNRWARWRGRAEPVDQSALPPHERRLIPAYAAIWLGGRGLALGLLLFVQLPLFASYLFLFWETLTAPGPAQPVAVTTWLSGLLFSTLLIAGLALWARQLWPRKG
ncbi:M50 family metallopeptidase [Tahibacter harae]|uniref:M50 family metallopeptidase n=1 Tax=Tahibacter harae TaxID=2963937 RepID=A0ABT1QPJ1_9GAMM|nr:M50 family metallopeptidase [Tahibacter harae]MCQ4164205.1 M50 family metallopeptidase [Tahibacter harae]